MKKISLILASILLALSFVLFVGGLGGFMWVFTMFPELSKFTLWSVSVSNFVVWFGGIIICAVRFRNFSKQIRLCNHRAMLIPDYIVVFGHIVILIAIVNWLGRQFDLWNMDLFYGLLLLAASLYALGLSSLALTDGSKRALYNKIHP